MKKQVVMLSVCLWGHAVCASYDIAIGATTAVAGATVAALGVRCLAVQHRLNEINHEIEQISLVSAKSDSSGDNCRDMTPLLDEKEALEAESAWMVPTLISSGCVLVISGGYFLLKGSAVRCVFPEDKGHISILTRGEVDYLLGSAFRGDVTAKIWEQKEDLHFRSEYEKLLSARSWNVHNLISTAEGAATGRHFDGGVDAFTLSRKQWNNAFKQSGFSEVPFPSDGGESVSLSVFFETLSVKLKNVSPSERPNLFMVHQYLEQKLYQA